MGSKSRMFWCYYYIIIIITTVTTSGYMNARAHEFFKDLCFLLCTAEDKGITPLTHHTSLKPRTTEPSSNG